MLAIERESSVLYRHSDGRLILRTGYCSKCGACCKGCVLHDAETMLCTDYGGSEYLGFGCNTWPSEPDCVRDVKDSCTYKWTVII